MSRQPTWHRWWREFLCSRAIRAARNDEGSSGAVRVGIIGAGRVSRRHLYGYLKTGKASIVAASDTESKRRERAQRRWKIAKVYGDFQDMLNQEQLDMVSVCVPPRFHRQAVLAAAHAGAKAVLCEKPIGLDLREADEMIRVCREHGVILAIGHQRRFGAQHRRAKQLLKEGAVGEIRHVVAQCPPDILRAGIHCADMLLDYVGPIARVSASLSDSHGGKARSPQDACFSTQSRDEDSWIFVEFTNGLQATVRVDDRSPLDAKLTFLGEKGAIQVWWDGGLRYRSSQDNVWTVPALELNPYLDEFYFEIDSILRALTSKTALEIPGEAGRNSLEVILAILIANQEGRSVSLPLANTAGAQSKVDST